MILLPLCFIWTNLACIMMIGTRCEVFAYALQREASHVIMNCLRQQGTQNEPIIEFTTIFKETIFFFLFLGIAHVPQSQYKDSMEYGLLYNWSNLARSLYPPFFFFFFLFSFSGQKGENLSILLSDPRNKKSFATIHSSFFFLFFFCLFVFFDVVFKCYQRFFKGFLLKSWLYHFFSQLIQAHI